MEFIYFFLFEFIYVIFSQQDFFDIFRLMLYIKFLIVKIFRDFIVSDFFYLVLKFLRKV